MSPPSATRPLDLDARAACQSQDLAELVPHKPSRIEFVLQDPGAALHVPVDGGRIPRPSAWRRRTVLIKIAGDVARRPASDVFLEYAPDDFRLSLDNDPLTPVASDWSVAIAEPAGHCGPVGRNQPAPCGPCGRCPLGKAAPQAREARPEPY